jgi:hypothetical protein
MSEVFPFPPLGFLSERRATLKNALATGSPISGHREGGPRFGGDTCPLP